MIHINAKQTKMQFTKNGPITYRYVLRPVNYSRLAEKKVIAEASVRSGIAKGALKGAWDAIGEVLKAWLTEGHSVAIPGLGTLRFSVSGQSVEDVNDVAKDLIKSRKVVYTPSTDIKDELKGTNISITCYDKDGKEVKRVQDDASDETIDDGEDEGNGNTTTGGNTGTGDNTGNGGTTGGGGNNDDPDNGME
jgi:predicted histone-like DNA-binding protein